MSLRGFLRHVLLAIAAVGFLPGAARAAEADPIARGRYLIVVGHCNNCHTPGYVAAEGKVAEEKWLVGNRLGYRSPVGTTYPTNLRLYVQDMTEETWLVIARNKRMRPPMPFWSLRDTTDDDLRAMFRFIRKLGPAGQPAPAFLPPEQAPPQPYWVITAPK